MQSAVFGYFAETHRKSILCLFFIVTKHLKKLLKVCLLRCAVVGSVMRFSRFFETIQITTYIISRKESFFKSKSDLH